MTTFDPSDLTTRMTGTAICADCLDTRLGIPRPKMHATLVRIANGLTITTTVAPCDSCLTETVVHKLG